MSHIDLSTNILILSKSQITTSININALYCDVLLDVPHDVVSYKRANLLAASHRC